MKVVKKNKVKQTKVVFVNEEYESDPVVDKAVRAYPLGMAQLAIRVGISPVMLSRILGGSRRMKEKDYNRMIKILG